MANYVLSNKAVGDLSAIWNYSFDNWSEKQADKYYSLLLEACQELASEKVSGKHFPEINKEIFGFRILQHIIFFRPIKKDKIEVIRILHVSMHLKTRITE